MEAEKSQTWFYGAKTGLLHSHEFKYPSKFIHSSHYNRCPLIIYYEQMILNFSLWVHNCIARCEIEIKDEENGLKLDRRQNFSLRFYKLRTDSKPTHPVLLYFRPFQRSC